MAIYDRLGVRPVVNAAGTLTRLGDEPAVVEGLVPVSLAGARAVFLAGSEEANRKAVELADPGTVIIDLTGSNEERPDARLRAPLLESEIDEPEVEAEGEAGESVGGGHADAQRQPDRTAGNQQRVDEGEQEIGPAEHVDIVLEGRMHRQILQRCRVELLAVLQRRQQHPDEGPERKGGEQHQPNPDHGAGEQALERVF